MGRVTSMLESSIASEKEAAGQGNQQGGSADKMPPTSHTLMDLIIAMSIYLPRSSFGGLFSLAAVILNGGISDQQLTKKAYKLIPRLATTEVGSKALAERSTELQTLMLSTADKTPSSARRDRLLAIHELITYLPTSDLHFIPSILSETVLGCKESNEKARTAAFELLVHLARRTIDPERNPAGTKIRNFMVPHMPDNAADAPATIEEFFTMVSAGLAGSSPHMVAASVTALSRLFFDFHTQLQPSIVSDLVQTVELFLTSNNREIVKSVLGFIKVAVVVLPDDILRPRLDSLVPKLMVWSKEHKGRLRSKVKGILDRLIRQFGAPLIEQLVGDSDRKLVVNIRKVRERRKRRKALADDEEDEEEGKDAGGGDDNKNSKSSGTKSFANAFDSTVYSSDYSDESGLDDDDDDDDASEIEIFDEEGNTGRSKQQGGNNNKKNKSSKQGGSEQYIRELSPEDNPLDLLSPKALANISTTKPSVRFLNTGQDARKKRQHRAKFDQDGRLIINDDDHDGDGGDDDIQMSGGATDAGGVNAFLDAVSGPDAARRGQRGKLKMSQRKKGGDDDADGMDLDDDDDGAGEGGGSGSGRRGLGIPKTHGPSRLVKKNITKNNGRNSRGKSFKVGKKR